jgi:hypothetical protein
MDMPTTIFGQRNVFYGKLLIDQNEYLQHYPHHTNNHGHAVVYIVQKHRQEYPYTEPFRKNPLQNPFVHIKIILNDVPKKILTILPAQKLINCTDGSQLNIISNNIIFHLICSKNKNFIIDEKYFPQNKEMGDSFERQFLSSMNEFYDKPAYSNLHCARNELIPQQVVKEIIAEVTLSLLNDTGGRMTIQAQTLQSQHATKGCSSEQHLIALATNLKTKNDQYSTFRYVTRRAFAQKPQPKCNLSIDFNFILTTCLREIEYADRANEKILNDCFNELIARNALARIYLNQLVMRTFTRFIVNQLSHKNESKK